MTDESKEPLKLFYCYAREDKILRDELDVHLASLKRQNLITSWYDGEISPGANWKKKIDTQLREAHLILLLITPHFMASDYCYGIEMKRALERHEIGTARVIPIIMRRTYLWENAPFGPIQALPADAKPVIQWGDRDEAFWNIAEGVHKAIIELLNQLKTAEAELQAKMEAQRSAAQVEAQNRQKRQNRPLLFLPASVPCPNCGAAVKPDDNFCSNCCMALSPSESGYHIRAMKPPLPPVQHSPAPPSPSRSIAEQPTIDMTPGLPNEQPTLEMSPALPNGQIDPEITVPYGFVAQPVKGQRLGIVVGTRSDPGIKRKYKPNEDSLFAAHWQREANTEAVPFGLFVVADGMGGHANGQDASRSAIQTIIDFMLPKLSKTVDPYSKDLEQLLANAVQHANQVVHQHNLELRADMGTTVTAALIVGATAYVSNVGDSRTYLYRAPDGLKKVTNDHSVVASLVEAGIIRPDDIYTHPKRNQIYRRLGEKASVEVDSFVVHLQPGDKLLLCSDGLWEMVRDPKIEGVLKSAVPDLNMTADALTKAALDGGGEDNVSVIVISLTETPQHTVEHGIQLLAKPDAVQMPHL
jgi:serine/threonine protein phosphatase PrpC